MLYLDAASVVKGVNVFRDYNDKTLFHVLPGSPRVATEGGQPMFQLLVYRDAGTADSGVQGGGFLTMTTDLALPQALLEDVRTELSSRHGVAAQLVPLQVRQGTVRVVALDSAASGAEPGADGAAGGIRFVENLLASGKPSLYGDQRAVFTAELSRQGAVLMQAALKQDGATPVSVIYDFEYVGLMPAYEVKIRIDFRQSYEHLRSRAQMNTLWFKTDIDSEMESLRKSGAIHIEEVVYATETPEDAAARMTRLNTLAKELAQWSFFKPALNPGAVLAADRGTLAAYDSTTDMSRITAGLTGTSAAALTGVGASEDAGAPRRPGAAVATASLEEAAAAPQTPTAPTTPATPAPAPAASAAPETAVEAWNRAGRPQGAFLLRNLTQDERQSIEYELRQVSAVTRSIAPQGQLRLLPGASALPGRIVEVDLNAEFFKTIEGSITTTADLAALGVASMAVKLRYGLKPDGRHWKDEHEAPLRAAGDRSAYRFFVDHVGTRELEYQVVLFNRPDSAIGHDAATEESAWIPTTTRNLDINPLQFSRVMRVQLEAAMVDWDRVRQVQARIRYEDPRSGLTAADTRILTREQPSARVPIRPRDPGVRDVTVEAVFFYADGGSETLTLHHDGGEPFVINQPPDSTTLVDVTLADLLQRYARISVQLGRPDTTPPQVKQTLTLAPDSTTQRWSFRRAAPDDTAYAYRVTSFLRDGAMRESDWTVTDNPLLVVGDRAAGVLTVQVVLLGTLADAGLRLAKLTLDYPQAPAWADRNVEHLFDGRSGEFTWRVPMGDPAALDYTWTVTWFRADGQRITSGPHTARDEILLLDPLAP